MATIERSVGRASLFLEAEAAMIPSNGATRSHNSPAGQEPALAGFSADVYSGLPIWPRIKGLNTNGAPIVIDIGSTRCDRYGNKLPVLFSHNRLNPIGHTTRVDIGATIRAQGVFSVPGPTRDMVVGAARAGFKWAVSVGYASGELTRVEKGRWVKVNGRDMHGPLFISRRGTIKEISILTIGADSSASATVK